MVSCTIVYLFRRQFSIIYAKLNKPANSETAQPAQQEAAAPVETTEPAIKISAVQLFQDYKSNEVAADKKYRDKTLEISGTVQSIDKDMLTDEPAVQLASGENDMGMTSVTCTFRAEHSDTLAQLQKGQHVVLRGKGAGFNIGLAVEVHYCEPVK